VTPKSSDLDYDDNGNMISSIDNPASSYEYNWDNKLRSAAKGSDSISLKYDSLGNRIYKDSSVNGKRKYIVDIVSDLPVILMEIDTADSSLKKTYIYANSQIIAQHDGDHTANRYFYQHDRLGNVRQIIKPAGMYYVNLANHYTYNPFGELFPTEFAETVSNSFRFTGQYYDSEINEYYLRARQYSPHIGRFTGRDLIDGKFEQPLTLHKYLYCINDPVDKVDPWGLDSIALYDGSDDSMGIHFANAADDFDWNFNVSSPEYGAALVDFLSLLDVEIDDLYIFDHGYADNDWQGRQEIGNTPLMWNSSAWKTMASAVEEKGSIHLRGCSIAAGSAGKKYIMLLARSGGRNVDAFDDLVIFETREGMGPDYFSYGNLWSASPVITPPLNISKGGWYREYWPFRRW